jgi:cell division protein FtsB
MIKNIVNELWPPLKKRFLFLPFAIGIAFCFLLVLWLVFSPAGVIDYFTMRKVIDSRLQTLEKITSDNQKLDLEVTRIGQDKDYQKVLAREHLGVIAKDEYLILFAKD